MSEHKSLAEALAAAQGEYPPIEKKELNSHFGKKYADLAGGMEPVRPILARHGISYTQTFDVVDGTIFLQTRVMAAGEASDSKFPITQPPNPQDFVKTSTYYRRVQLFSALGIFPQGEDDDGNTAREVANTQEPPRKERQPQAVKANGNGRHIDTRGVDPKVAVDTAIEASQSAGIKKDPWELLGIPLLEVLPKMKQMIAEQPWSDVEPLVHHYYTTLDLTPHERSQVKAAFRARKDAREKAETTVDRYESYDGRVT